MDTKVAEAKSSPWSSAWTLANGIMSKNKKRKKLDVIRYFFIVAPDVFGKMANQVDSCSPPGKDAHVLGASSKGILPVLFTAIRPRKGMQYVGNY
jgi:hypothetical protein